MHILPLHFCPGSPYRELCIVSYTKRKIISSRIRTEKDIETNKGYGGRALIPEYA